MKHLIQLANMIQAAGLGVIGQTIFIGTIPADVKSGVMLRDPMIGVEIDKGMSGFYSADITVIVRDPEVQAGYAKAESISAVLDVANVDAPEIFISWLHPATKPISYPRGDANDLETSFRLRMGWGEKA